MKTLFLALGLLLCGTVIADERYNPMSGEWETAGADDELRYNPMEHTWSFEDEDADLEYQPMQRRWDYEEDDEHEDE